VTRAGRPRGKRAASHARRVGPPLRRRLRARLPPLGRVVAVLAMAGLVAGLVVLVNGPWLRIRQVAWAGQRFTAGYELERILGRLRGTQLLALDSTALAADLAALPAVSEVRVEASLPDRLRVTLVERKAAFIWRTSAVQLVCAADGIVIGQVALRSDVPKDLADLPRIDDRRGDSRNIIVGDRLDSATFGTALRLAAIQPATLGSSATGVTVQLDDEYGFVLVAVGAPWKAAFGGYALDAGGRETGSSGSADEILAQVAAVRTLFSVQPEASVSWVDARNPGKVYWRP
jgi:POTRA domain, FtsQ-type